MTEPAVPLMTGDHAQKFFFSREMMGGPVYRKYEKAVRAVWNPLDIDFERDARDWQTLTDDQQRGLLGITVRFFAGEQAVTNDLLPMIEGAQALGRFDWVMYLSTFLFEEAKHAQFFAVWHERVVGILEPDELAAYFLERSKTVDPSGRFEVKEVLHEGLPRYGRALKEAIASGDQAEVVAAFVRYATLYNSYAEGVLTMPSYEIVLDTVNQWGKCRALKEGFGRILADEGRHITFGTTAIRLLLEQRPDYEELVHGVFDEFRGNVVGLVEYQKAVPGLAIEKYQLQKVRHYRNRCREMNVTPDETLIDQILDPTIDFVVGVEAG